MIHEQLTTGTNNHLQNYVMHKTSTGSSAIWKFCQRGILYSDTQKTHIYFIRNQILLR